MSRSTKVQSLEIPWRKVVLDADADWAADRHRELEYEFSAPGRRFWGDPYKRGPYKPRPYNNGRLNRTLARMQAQGTVLIDGRSGELSITFEQLGFSAAGYVPVLGVMGATLDGLGVAATGAVPATGTLNRMLDWMRTGDQFGPMWISVGVGRVDIKGVGIGATGPMTSTGTGTVSGAQPGEGSPVGLLLAITMTPEPPIVNLLPNADNHSLWADAVGFTASQTDRLGGSTAESWVEHSGAGDRRSAEVDGIATGTGRFIAEIYYKQLPGSNANRQFEMDVLTAGTLTNGVWIYGDKDGNIITTDSNGPWTVHSATITPSTNGFYLMKLDFTTTDAAILMFIAQCDIPDVGSYTGDGVSGWLIDDHKIYAV